MNDKLQQALAEIINKANSGMDSAISFLSTEIPEIISQLLIWKLCESLITMAFGAVMIYAAYRLGVVTKSIIAREMEKDWLKRNEPLIVLYCFCTGVIALIGISSLSKIYTAAQIIISPKIYLIEYAAKLAK